ncbi:hypothetical protein JTB14_013688 [Gonioctena quinquepunctata]|nr:hypothetical protein JTB14_013688 [Gonioctena quinquepunctata]
MEEAHNNNISLDEMVTSILDDVIEELQDQSGNSILAEFKKQRKGKNTGNALDETVTNILDEVVKELQGKSPGKLKSKKAKKNGGNISLDEITEDNLKTGSGFRRRELQNDLSNEIGDILEKVVEEFNSEEKSQVAQKTRRKNKNKSNNIEEFQENPPIEQKTKGNKNTSNISTDEISTVSDISREENSLVELKCKRKKKETKIPIEEISTLNAIFAEKKHLVELKENSNEISTVSDISTEKKSLVELKTKRKKEKENISADEISPVSDIYQGEITPDELKTKRITAKSNISTEKISTVSDWSIVEKPLVKLETKRKKGAKISTDEISTDISREISDILQNGDEQIPVENTQTPTRKKRKQKANSLDEAVARMLEKPDSNKATVDIENEVNSQVGKKVERKKKESASLEDKEDEHEQETSLNKSIKNSQKQDKTPNHKDSENNVLLNEKTTSDMESSGSPIKVHGKQVEKTHSSDMEEKVAKVAREIVTTAFSDSDSSDYSMDPKEMNRTISNKMKSKSKDADSEKIRNLDIVIPFALPPLHVHLDRPSKPTSYEISACQEFKIKTGPFSEEEDQKIKNNWERFCEQHHLDIEPTAFFRLPHKMAIETKRKFLQYISHGLDDRTPQRVHHRFKTLFGNSAKKTGRFSNEEDEQILEFMEMTNSNKPYADLSEILDRPSNSIQRRYNLLKRQTGTDRENREKISWTPSKADKLIRRMLKVCRLEKVEQLRDAKITAEQWNKLALKMGDMPIKNLRSAWKITIYPRLFASTDDLARIKKSLLDILYERKETDWRLVDWKDISKQYSGFSPEKLYMMFKKLVLFNVPKLLQKDIQKSIEYLLKGRISKTHKFRRYTFKNGHLVYDDESDDNDFTM